MTLYVRAMARLQLGMYGSFFSEEGRHVKCRRWIVVSQFETMATQSPPIHRAGGGVGPWETRSDCLAHRPPVGCRYACHDVRRRVSPGPTHPARPLRGAHGRIDDSRGEVLVRDRKSLRAPNLPTTRWLECGRDRRSMP